jgi:hypothetical protein
MKVDAYKLGDKNKFVPTNYIQQQPRYRLSHAKDENFDGSLFGLTKTQVHILRFIEVSLLSPAIASDMLSIAKHLGSKLTTDTLLLMNIGALTTTKFMMDNMRNLARTKYNQSLGFEEMYFLTKRKDVLRSLTSAMTFQLLIGIDHYYKTYKFVDFAGIIEDTEIKDIFWNTTKELSPLQILMGKYLTYFNEYISNDEDFTFNYEVNLVAAFYLGHVKRTQKAFSWCASYERIGLENYTDEHNKDLFDALSNKNNQSVTVPISFKAYLEDLFLNETKEKNETKKNFLKHPKEYIYRCFYDKPVPNQSETQKKRKKEDKQNPEKYLK